METEVRTIREFVDEIGEKYGQRVAYRFFREESVDSRTYKNLRDDVYGLGSYFVKRGYKDKHIALLGGTSYEWVVSFLAVIVSGNVVIPIDKMLLEEEMMNLFRSGDVDVIFYDNAYEDVAQKAKKNIEQVKSIKDMSARDFTGLLCTKEGKIPDTDIHSVAEILFTSGTTGKSKGVMLTQNNLAENVISVDYEAEPGSVLLSVLPIHHAFCLVMDWLKGFSLGILGVLGVLGALGLLVILALPATGFATAGNTHLTAASRITTATNPCKYVFLVNLMKKILFRAQSYKYFL